MRRAVWCLFALSLALIAPLAAASQVKEDPLERQMLDIAAELRCAVCQNQSVADSQADLAKDMRRQIRAQLEQGKSRAQIIQFFVDRYGDYVLLKPPMDRAGTVVWLLPFGIAAIVALAAFVYLRRRLRPDAAPPPPLSDEDAARVRAAREGPR